MSAFAEEMDNNCVNGSAQAENVFFPGGEEPLRENPPRISEKRTNDSCVPGE